MKEAIAWFYTIDKKLWGDRIETNPYFATLSILFVALVGACSGAGRIFYEWFDWDVATNNVAMAYLFILIWGVNLCEFDRGIGIGMDRAVAPAVDVVDFCAGFCVRIYSLGGRDFPCDGMVVLMLAGALHFRFGR